MAPPVVPISHDDVTAEVAADELDPLVGVTIEGRFRVVGIVGKGAMGRVYRAVQLPLNRAVALKVLDQNYGPGREEAFRRRFLVEAALTGKLTHPNTVRVLDYGVSSRLGLLYLAMEYLDGETLDRLLAEGPLPWRRVLGIAQQVARALREAHDLGVVHRDLKPSNVMLLNADADHDFVKVLDFGLVKSFVEGEELEGRAITKQGMLMGSPPYMAPEQGDRNVADPRSDIYSLGIVMYEALSGQPPFVGTQPLEIILKHVNEAVPPLSTPRGLEEIPEAMTAVVMKCLAKSPMDRFQTMEEVLAAMQELAVPLPTRETPAVTAPPLRRTSSAVLVVGFLLTMAAGMGATALVMKGPWASRAPAEAASRVVFHVETEPPGATVSLRGAVLGATPLDVELAPGPGGRTEAEFTLSKPGFLPATAKAAGTGARIELSQTLIPAPPGTEAARAGAEQRSAEKTAADRLAAEERAAADRRASEARAAEKAAAERKAEEKASADTAAAEKRAAEKAAAEKKAADLAAERKAAAERAAAKKAADENAAAEKAAAEKKAAAKAAAKKQQAKKAAAAASDARPTSSAKLDEEDDAPPVSKDELKRPAP